MDDSTAEINDQMMNIITLGRYTTINSECILSKMRFEIMTNQDLLT